MLRVMNSHSLMSFWGLWRYSRITRQRISSWITRRRWNKRSHRPSGLVPMFSQIIPRNRASILVDRDAEMFRPFINLRFFSMSWLNWYIAPFILSLYTSWNCCISLLFCTSSAMSSLIRTFFTMTRSSIRQSMDCILLSLTWARSSFLLVSTVYSLLRSVRMASTYFWRREVAQQVRLVRWYWISMETWYGRFLDSTRSTTWWFRLTEMSSTSRSGLGMTQLVGTERDSIIWYVPWAMTILVSVSKGTLVWQILQPNSKDWCCRWQRWRPSWIPYHWGCDGTHNSLWNCPSRLNGSWKANSWYGLGLPYTRNRYRNRTTDLSMASHWSLLYRRYLQGDRWWWRRG